MTGTAHPDYLAALDRAWRAVDAECGTGMSPETTDAFDAVTAAIEALGGMDPRNRQRAATVHANTDEWLAASLDLQGERPLVDKLMTALCGVISDAEIGRYLIERAAVGEDGYERPREFAIIWEWQQSAPGTTGMGALLGEVDSWLRWMREDGAQMHVLDARALVTNLTKEG